MASSRPPTFSIGKSNKGLEIAAAAASCARFLPDIGREKERSGFLLQSITLKSSIVLI